MAHQRKNLTSIKPELENNARGIVVTVGAGKRPATRSEYGWEHPKSLISILKSVYSSQYDEKDIQLPKDAATWEELKWLIKNCNLPVVLKGILDKFPTSTVLAKNKKK